ncbi:MAG: hypothetical protein HONBIEJF_02431 [Fimbriimonadaceae bacterium]|nr:hypothetical protein [Fimbriimonadaceae bacterium]
MSDWLDAHALADGQLSEDEASAVRAKLETCTQTKSEFEAVCALRETVKRGCDGSPNPELWDKCRGRLDEIDRLKRTERFVGKYAWALCGLFFIAITSAGVLNRLDPSRSMRSSEVASMFSSLSPFRTRLGPQDIPNVLNQEVGSAPVSVPPGDLRVIGMARRVIDGRPVVRFELQDRVGPISVLAIGKAYKIEGLSDDQVAMHEWKAGSRNCVSWVDRDVIMVVASEREMSLVRELAESFSTR